MKRLFKMCSSWWALGTLTLLPCSKSPNASWLGFYAKVKPVSRATPFLFLSKTS
jgi:hypothetical protein